jgi:dihydroorotate dehydrogenase (fumarate)
MKTRPDLIKYLLAGADVVMTTSALLRHGVEHLGTLLDGLAEWMKASEITSVSMIRGRLSQLTVEDAVAYACVNHIRILQASPVADAK